MTRSGRNIRVDRIFPTSGTLEVDGKLEFTNSLGIGTELPQANLHVVGNTYVSSNLEVGQANLFVDTTSSRVGVGTTEPDATLHVVGNAYVSSNLEVGQANLFVDTTSSRVGVGTTEPDATLHVDGNTYVSSNLEVGQANLFVDTTSSRVGVGTTEPDATLHVVGNAYVSSNLEVGQANLFVDTTSSRVGVGTATPQANLHVEGNAFVSSNLEVAGPMRITDGLSNVCDFSIGAVASEWEVGTKIVASDAAISDWFGHSVAIDGDYAIVGAHFNDDGVRSATGSAYIFRRTGTHTWDTGTKIVASDAAANDFFGFSVAIDGDYAIVGAYGNDDGGSGSGSAYIFHRTGTNEWDMGTKIVASDAGGGDNFGYSVGISGDYAIVGAYSNDHGGGSPGSAYIFHRTNTWDTGTKIVASDAADGDFFGFSVAIDGDYAIVGATLNDDASGSAYIFHRTNTWDTGTKIVASDAADDDQFGYSVGISGDYAIVGGVLNDDGGGNSGSAYIFHRTNTWDTGTKIVASDADAGDLFGYSVGISGDYAIVGAYTNDDGGSNSGSAYIFHRTGTHTWDTGTKIVASDAADGDQFGRAVGISGDYAIVGAYGNNLAGSNSGSAYIHPKANTAGLSVSIPIQAGGNLLSFTGQHICFPEGPMSQGLVVSANKNKYVSLNGSLTTGTRAIKSSEALPVVSLSNVANDRSVFGVVDHFEQGGTTRSQKSGIGIITQDKEIGDNRVIVNSLGEGGIWVADTNGNVASGDFMTTSHLPGYAQRQDDDILRNSTVAKSTMDCDFNPLDIPVQKIKKDENGTNILDTYDRLQWEDTDRTEKAYRVRYLTTEGELTDEANAVHTAAFIGCTYHCG
jgi:hypothetical protein